MANRSSENEQIRHSAESDSKLATIRAGAFRRESEQLTTSAQHWLRNRMLSTLPLDDWEILSRSLELVELKSRQVLHLANTPVEYAYFVERGLVSASVRVTPEKWAEVWLVGSDGMVGVPLLLGDAQGPAFREIVQVGGLALRIAAKDLLKARELSPSLDIFLLRYCSLVLLQTSQSGACNAHHTVKQRLARWLLLASFALHDERLPITHNVLSRLLGVRRPTVTMCLGVLEEEQCIRMGRGLIEVIDPEQLERTGCHCLQAIKQAYMRFLRN